MFPLFSSIEQTYYSITTNICGSLKHACVWLGLCVHFLSFKIREIQFVPLKVWINSRVKNASSKRWLEHQSKHICACGKHPGGYWPDLYGCWLGLSHSTLRKGTSDEKKKKKILLKAIHSWKSWVSFIFWKWVIGLLSIESIKLKPLSIEILLEHLCSMMKIKDEMDIFSLLSVLKSTGKDRYINR